MIFVLLICFILLCYTLKLFLKNHARLSGKSFSLFEIEFVNYTNYIPMKNSLFLAIVLCLGCTNEIGCVEITRKEKSGSNFLFFWEEGNLFSNNTFVDEYGAIPSGVVSEDVYNQYQVGDTYCTD